MFVLPLFTVDGNIMRVEWDTLGERALKDMFFILLVFFCTVCSVKTKYQISILFIFATVHSVYLVVSPGCTWKPKRHSQGDFMNCICTTFCSPQEDRYLFTINLELNFRSTRPDGRLWAQEMVWCMLHDYRLTVKTLC